jgi:hypothetical protein
MFILSAYVCAHVRKSGCARSMHFSVRARALVRECVCVCVCARAAGAAAQPDRATSKCDSPCVYVCVSKCIGVSITCMRVCARACVVTLYGFARSTFTSVPWCAAGAGRMRVVRGRSIAFTKVHALPESLGQCKLLEELCVAPAAVRVCGGAGAALPRVRAGRRAAPRGVGCGGGGVAGRRPPSPRAHVWRVRGGPEPLGAAALVARRDASKTDIAALPAAAEWPNLKTL